MPNPLQLAGSQNPKPTKYVPLFTNRFFSGLWTQRNPLRDAASSYQVEKFYGPRMDALIDGLNCEVTNSLTLKRRPGLSVYNNQTFPAVDAFYSFRTFTTNSEAIRVLADTAATVYDATGPSTKTTLFAKSAGAGQSFFQSVGNTLYFGNGVDQEKWIFNPWQASTTYSPGQVVTDSNNNVEQVVGVRFSTGYAINQLTISANNIATFQVVGAPTMPDGSPVLVGTTVVMYGLTGLVDVNGVFATVASAPVSVGAGNYTFTVNLAHTSYPISPETGSVYTISGSAPSGGSSPTWAVGTGGITTEGSLAWKNTGSAVQRWGIAAPTSAPTVANATLPSSLPTWVANTFYSTSLLLLDSNGNIQKLTQAGTTGGAPPVWSAIIGGVTNDNTAQWTCQGSGTWAANHGYVSGNVVAVNWSVTVWVPTGGGPLPPCFTPDTAVKTDLGPMRIDEIKAGDRVFARGTLRKVLKVLTHEFKGAVRQLPGVASGVTPDHLMWVDGEWARAVELYPDTFEYEGTVYNLTIEADNFDDHCYDLLCGETAHNNKALPPPDDGPTGYWQTTNYSSFFRCSVSGTSGLTQPTWNFGNITDNSVTWVNIGTVVVWNGATSVQIAVGAGTLVSLAQTIIDANNNQETITGTGKSGGVAPTWATAVSATTVDGTAMWTNAGPSPSIPNTAAWIYAYSFGNSSTGHFSTASPLSSAFTLAGNSYASLQGVTSSDPQVDTIRIWRTKQGGSTLFFLNDISQPSGPTWTYGDTAVDSTLNVLITAPIASSNNPPPTGLTALAYHLGRVWGAVGNTVYYSNGPNTLVGNGNEAFPPLNNFVYPSQVKRLWPSPLGLLVFTVSDIYIIAGQGTTTSILYTYPFLEGIGIRSYNAFAVNGSIVMLMTSDNQTLAMDPSSGVSEIGFPIGDKLAAFDPSESYLTWHVAGSQDKALYTSDGATGWYRLNPTSAPESGQTWNPFAQLVGGCKAVQSIETSPGVHNLLVSPATSGPILTRNLNVFSDNGGAYPCFATVGSIVLAHPSQIAHVLYITTECRALGSHPTVGLLLDEIGPPATFETLSKYTNDPAITAPSQSLYSDRFYVSQTQQPAVCRHLQIKFTFPSESFGNELLTYTIVGAAFNER